MADLLYALSGVVITTTLLTLLSRSKTGEWEQRGFVNLLLPWNKTFLFAAVLNLVVTLATVLIGGTWWQGVILGILGWMLVFTSVTDFAVYKIPRETSNLASLLPIALAVPLTWGQSLAYISTGVWLGLLFVLALMSAFMKGGIGWADMRLFFLMGTALSWWVGIDWMVYAFAASAVVQLLIFLVSKVTGWGRIKPVGSLESLSKEESRVFKEAQRKAKTEGTEVPKGRKVLPFGPSILVAFLVMGMIAAAVGRDACSAYDGLLCL